MLGLEVSHVDRDRHSAGSSQGYDRAPAHPSQQQAASHYDEQREADRAEHARIAEEQASHGGRQHAGPVAPRHQHDYPDHHGDEQGVRQQQVLELHLVCIEQDAARARWRPSREAHGVAAGHRSRSTRAEACQVPQERYQDEAVQRPQDGEERRIAVRAYRADAVVQRGR